MDKTIKIILINGKNNGQFQSKLVKIEKTGLV